MHIKMFQQKFFNMQKLLIKLTPKNYPQKQKLLLKKYSSTKILPTRSINKKLLILSVTKSDHKNNFLLNWHALFVVTFFWAIFCWYFILEHFYNVFESIFCWKIYILIETFLWVLFFVGCFCSYFLLVIFCWNINIFVAFMWILFVVFGFFCWNISMVLFVAIVCCWNIKFLIETFLQVFFFIGTFCGQLLQKVL